MVHGANFLVERHTRVLLCQVCQSPTSWKASGARLGNALSLCESCAGGNKFEAEEREESEGDNDDDVDTDYDEDEDEDDVEGDEDGDNQVVPWSSTAAPPPASSCSASEESVSRCNSNDEVVSSQLATTVSLKRRREDHDLQGSNSRNNGAKWREEVDLLGYDGEPLSKLSTRRFCDQEGSEHSQPHD